ncbi:MAG: proline dehydrogenase family protein [Planctomycetes bacterium]|nr:proline dehydrogenase family protein [Planctomycetota bacterium]MCB9910618.1 proline dehydrogenase family protein [Planctomycetota bacterium]HPF12996.1 proline dehydrogenase family protein [Planctomycetota bacterium]HRV81558.1 proline dehydrogenase family protein [Planctomycetota bacterium]
MGILHKIVVSTLPLIPRPIMRQLSSRYIAGETLEEALGRLQTLHDQGFGGVLDILGEDVEDEREARSVLEQYKLGAVALKERGFDCYVSVKPTHFGLRQSPELAFSLYDELLGHCASLGQTARVEMEDHGTTDATLNLFARLRAKHDNVGIVLQSRLFRTPRDIQRLPEAKINVRMVKGIYLEPESIAHTDAGPIRQAYIEQCKTLWAGGHYVAIASHDGGMAEELLSHIAAHGIGTDQYCFEVLLGVQEPLWQSWLSAGHPVRVYVPYGPDWRAYSQRRLRKNPQMLGHVTKGVLRSLVGK